MDESILVESINDKIKALRKELSYWKSQHRNDDKTIFIIMGVEHEIENTKDRLNQIQTLINQ